MIKFSCNNGEFVEDITINGSLINLVAEMCTMNVYILDMLKKDANDGQQLEKETLMDIWEMINETVSKAFEENLL